MPHPQPRLKRSQFDRSSEEVQREIDQLQLALKDLQTDPAANQAGDGDPPERLVG